MHRARHRNGVHENKAVGGCKKVTMCRKATKYNWTEGGLDKGSVEPLASMYTRGWAETAKGAKTTKYESVRW